MQLGLLAFAAASGFCGAAFYISLVEQPARLRLGGRAMIWEWINSNRRGVVMLSVLAIASALFAYAEVSRTQDIRWLIGAVVILVSLPYSFFVMIPANIRLAKAPQSMQRPALRQLMNDWGLLEWVQTAIGLGACVIFGWALAQPL
jgi:hypothetical protein